MSPRAEDWSSRRHAAEALRERTEGWAAAVALATLSLRGRDDADMRAAGLSGNQEQIADYLLEEVLKRQPERLKRFLLGTSILERMSAPLCDAVLGTTDAAISLEALARSNAFVVPLDDRREWYRYHQLFSDLLRAGAHVAPPGAAPRVPGARSSLVRALRNSWTRRSPMRTRAAISLRRAESRLAHRDEFARRGQSESVRLWLERCTEEEIASDPQLSIAAAWVFLYRGDAGPGEAVRRCGRTGAARRGIRRRGVVASLGSRERPNRPRA